jgi:hypothetical protein
MNRRIGALFLLVSGTFLNGSLAVAEGGNPLPAAPRSPAIVIGFVGGYVKHDNMVHSEVQLAAEIRAAYPSDVYAGAFENHRGQEAYQQILRLLDANHDGMLTAEEKNNARIVLYGHSWGAAETLTLARELQKQGIPVLLTIQVDSVAKHGQNDRLVPANVAEAVNFYQRRGFIRTQRRIQAEDPEHTRIIGNVLFDYRGQAIRCENYPWWDRYIAKPHTQIECDPKVWNQVGALIRSKLPPPEKSAALPPIRP